jgi:hypothetical protein
MAVQIPPWLNIDPLAPARIKLAANAQRQQAAAHEAAQRQQAEELQFRREQAASAQAAHERAALRHEQVYKQTHDDELAQAAAQMQLRKESAAMKAEQFQQTLRLKEQKAEGEAATAAKQMQGMQAVQKGLQAGEPLAKLIAENAPLIYAKNPNQMTRAIPTGINGPITARNVMDEQGQPTGLRAIPGARGGVHMLPATDLGPQGKWQVDKARMGIITKQMEEAYGTPEYDILSAKREAIMKKYEGGASAAQAVMPGALPAGPVSAPAGDKVRVRAPNGQTGLVPRDQLDAALKEGFEEISAGKVDEAAPPDETEPADNTDEEDQEG